MELERKVILNEIAEAADNPHDKLAETLIKCLFKKHPIRNPVLGTKLTVKHLELAELDEAHQNWYAPQNMVVVLTGKYSQSDVGAVLADFQDRQNCTQTVKNTRAIEETKPKKQATITRSGISQAYLCFGLRTPPAKDPDATTLDLINGVLGLGESSRLFVELREKRALTYDFNSMNLSGLDHGFFTVACAVKAKFLHQTQEIIKGELEKIKSAPVSEGELEKSKNVIAGDIFRAMDDPHELPRLMTDTEIVYGNEKGLSDYVTKLKGLKPQDVLVTSNKFFQEDNYSTAILTPK
jgi:predicted Zn-dependent peptidase